MNQNEKSFWREIVRQSIAAFALAAIVAAPFAANAQQMSQAPNSKNATAAKAKSLTEDQKILHVLNRLGFGARPGDVERVRQTGVEKYVEQQLDAQKINDAALEARLQNFDALKMSNAELFAKYPNQGGVLQIVAERNGISRKELRGDMKEQKMQQRENENSAAQMPPNKQSDSTNNANAAAKNDPARNGAPQNNSVQNNSVQNGSMQNGATSNGANLLQQNQSNLTDAERREYVRQIAELYREYGFGRPQQITQQLNAARILRAVYSERQLQEQMVDFWSNHFNVYANKASTRWFLPEYDRDVIRPNALGSFKDLLVATAKSPAMLFYLDNFQSVAANNSQNQRRATRLQQLAQNPRMRERAKDRLRERFPNLSDAEIEQRLQKQMQSGGQMRRGINENYARELMELHTLGVDGGYSQKDIQEIARCFTGWTIIDARGYKKLAARMLGANDNKAIRGLQRLEGVSPDAESGTFYFNANQHDDGEKTVLGQKIPAGGGIEDGLKVIDILVKQPATAKFIARKLAVKFVSDNPSDALVNRAADAFLKSNGDIKTTLRAIFASPEFFAAENYRQKIKTPFEVVASALRVLGAETNAGPQLQGLLAKMGEPLYGYIAPTGYPDTAEDWVNTGALLERLNFGLALAANRIPGTKIDLTKFTGRDPDDKEKVMNTFLSVVLRDEVSPATKATLAKQLVQPLPEPKLTAENDDSEQVRMTAMRGAGGGKKDNGAKAANRLLPPSGNQETVKIVGLILGSPEFQRQ